MRTDLLDARDWAIAQGHSDPHRFAILGGSYGGYAVLAALTFTPDAFTCGVDIVGVSDLRTFIDSIPPYWKPMLAMLNERVGEDPAFLAAQSPLSRAADIRVPLLIGQGANDPRVRQAESDQIVEVMRQERYPGYVRLVRRRRTRLCEPGQQRSLLRGGGDVSRRALGGRVEPPTAEEDIGPYLR